jgi:hypothetical protein
MLFLDGVYVTRPDGSTRFRWVKAPTGQELTQLAHSIAHRVGRFLERQGLLERDAENSYLTGDAVDDAPMAQLLGSSITYRIADGTTHVIFEPLDFMARLATPAIASGPARWNPINSPCSLATGPHNRQYRSYGLHIMRNNKYRIIVSALMLSLCLAFPVKALEITCGNPPGK